MKIAFSAKGNDPDAMMDPRFGRCGTFIIADSETGGFEVMENTGVSMSGGAGIHAAQLVASSGAKAVVSGSFGPNAYNTLKAAGIAMYSAGDTTVRKAFEDFMAGRFLKVDNAGPLKK